MRNQENIHKRLKMLSQLNVTDLYRQLSVSENGLSDVQASNMRKKYGSNEVGKTMPDRLGYQVFKSFANPFSCILFALAIISFITDVVLQANFTKNYTTTITIILMILMSGVIRFVQNRKANKQAEGMYRFLNQSATIKRNDAVVSIPIEDIVVGDLVYLTAGDYVPCDMRIIEEKNLHISESSLTGESVICKKTSEKAMILSNEKIADYKNIAFMSTTVISGNGKGIATAVGKNTLYGSASKETRKKRNAYVLGENSISFVLIRFMLLMVSIVFVVSEITQGNLLSSFLFALSVAIGLTPEMLPLVITTCLAKGASVFTKKHTIVKNINAMQGFGSMDVLCMDKTGTITNDGILMEYYMDVLGNECSEVLDDAYLNSFYHSSSNNPIDNAILSAQTMPKKEQHFKNLITSFSKLDEIPFGYDRKYASVLVTNNAGSKLIVKGNIEQVLAHCTHFTYNGTRQVIEENNLQSVWSVVDEMLEDGMKVIAIAKKELNHVITLSSKEEEGLTLLGYIAFFDAPKKTAKQSIESLKSLSVKTKIVTGDSLMTAKSICKRVGINGNFAMTGCEIDNLSNQEFCEMVEKVDLFAELTPQQKLRIITALQNNGHSVGFLGDGMNDIPAICEADVGISVDTAVDTAKDAADVVLLQKDLNVLAHGILEGRKTFVNMLKYIKITTSSNFGNIISIVVASAFLPFMPMVSTQILLLNLLYDLLCIVLPWDRVEMDELTSSKEWSGRGLPRFMLSFGFISSVFDIITYLFLYFVLCPMLCGGVRYAEITDTITKLQYISVFQTGWFLESMWTQILILHILRTKNLKFWKSSASKSVWGITILGIVSFTLFTFTNAASKIGFTVLPYVYYVFLILIVIFYMLTTTIVKRWYIKKYHHLI